MVGLPVSWNVTAYRRQARFHRGFLWRDESASQHDAFGVNRPRARMLAKHLVQRVDMFHRTDRGRRRGFYRSGNGVGSEDKWREHG